MRKVEDIFEQWLDNKDTTKNVIEHLRGQKSFHMDFVEFLLAELARKKKRTVKKKPITSEQETMVPWDRTGDISVCPKCQEIKCDCFE